MCRAWHAHAVSLQSVNLSVQVCWLTCFPADNEPGTYRTSLVFSEQPVLCICWLTVPTQAACVYQGLVMCLQGKASRCAGVAVVSHLSKAASL